jgi:sulfite reductase (ferredoxin)
LDRLEAELEPIFIYFKRSRQPDESFGNFCDRVGLAAIHQFADAYTSELLSTDVNGDEALNGNSVLKVRHRITVEKHQYAQLQALASQTGKKVSQLAGEAIAKYLEQVSD